MGAQVSREPPPPLPGGYTVGEQVYFTGKSHILENGGRVVHGEQGEVVGPQTLESHMGKGVEVLFPGNKRAVSCYLSQVRRMSRRAATHSSPFCLSYPFSQNPPYCICTCACACA